VSSMSTGMDAFGGYGELQNPSVGVVWFSYQIAWVPSCFIAAMWQLHWLVFNPWALCVCKCLVVHNSSCWKI
jgi:hypothetical protein